VRQTQFLEIDQAGIILDLPPEEVPGSNYTSCSNVYFRDGAAARVEGYGVYGPELITADPIFAYPATYQSVNYWIHCTTENIYVTDGYTQWDITPAAGLSPTTAGEWTATTLNGIPVLNNPENAPIYWALNPANPCETLPGWPDNTTCNAIAAVKYHLVALNITEAGINYPSQVWWSQGAQAGAVPQEWIPTAENDAGDTILADSTGHIVTAYPLREQLIIYKSNATYTMQYVAGQYVYAFRKIFPNTGIASRHAVCEVDNQHWVFTGTDVVKHDGQNFISVVYDKVQRHLTNSIDPGQIQLVSLTARLTDNQVWVNIPTTGAQLLVAAVILDVRDGNVGLRTLPQVASVIRGTVSPTSELGPWESLDTSWQNWPDQWNEAKYLANSDGVMMTRPTNANKAKALLAVGYENSAEGEPISAYVERLSGMAGDYTKTKILTRVIPRIEAGAGTVFTFRLGAQAYFGDSILWGPPQQFIAGTDTGLSYIITGRYMSLRISTESIAPWKLYSYVIKYADQSTY